MAIDLQESETKKNTTGLVLRQIFSLMIPGGLLFFVGIYLFYSRMLDPWQPEINYSVSGMLLLLGLILGWLFNRSSLIYGLLVLLLAERSLFYVSAGEVEISSAQLVFHTVSILLPLNFSLLSLMKEKGTFSARGVLKLLLIVSPPLTLVLLRSWEPQLVQSYLNGLIRHLPEGSPFAASIPAVLIVACSIIVILIGYFKKKDPIKAGLFWALLISLIALFNFRSGRDISLCFVCAGLILTASVIIKSHRIAYLDELTRIPSRRSLNEALNRLGNRYSIAMVDIDFFKRFNDRYGHDVGDQVLKMVAAKLKNESGGGRVYRYGGEEFSILYSGKTVDEILPLVDDMREQVEHSEFILRNKKIRKEAAGEPKRSGRVTGKRLSVTVSVGVAQKNEKYLKAAEVIKAADRALYRAKRAGRNCVRSLR